jgi:hypothetical protein
MLREKCLKIPEVLGHRVVATIFPLGNICEVGYHLNGDLPLFLMLHLGMDGFKTRPQVLDREEADWLWDTTPMLTGTWGTSYAVLLRRR